MIDSVMTELAAFVSGPNYPALVIAWFILGMSIIQNLVYAAELPAAWLELREHSQAEDTESSWQLLISDVAPPISVLVPAHNEEAVIVSSLRAMLGLEYPNVEIIVVNDGSTDNTLPLLIEAFSLKPIARAYECNLSHKPIRGLYGSSLYPHLLVVDKEGGGSKADATNAGINVSRNPLFCVVDADSLLESAALLRAVRPFMEEPDRMVAVGGTIRILNGCEVNAGRVTKVHLPDQPLPLVQSLEYIRAFLMARLALSRWGVLTIISGAFGIFRRDLVITVGGFSHNMVGEDLELVVKLHRYLRDRKQDYAMRYVPEPVCWTQAPDSLAMLGMQRKRWQRGALECFFKHRGMLFNPRYGRIGFFGFPHSLIIDVLGPLVEVLGYLLVPVFYFAGVLDMEFMLAYVALLFVFGIFISVTALVLEEMELRRVPNARDLLILGTVSVVENFGYRQLNNIWRAIGWWDFLRKKQGWGVMVRKKI